MILQLLIIQETYSFITLFESKKSWCLDMANRIQKRDDVLVPNLGFRNPFAVLELCHHYALPQGSRRSENRWRENSALSYSGLIQQMKSLHCHQSHDQPHLTTERWVCRGRWWLRWLLSNTKSKLLEDTKFHCLYCSIVNCYRLERLHTVMGRVDHQKCCSFSVRKVWLMNFILSKKNSTDYSSSW